MSTVGLIVMAVYRPDPALLARQIDSLRGQTLTDWRCLIGIDGEDAGARALVDELVTADDRFEVRTYAENVGVYRHFERLLDGIAREVSWIALCDQDDYWYSTKLERLLAVLLSSGASAALGLARLVDDRGSMIGVTTRRPGGVAQMILKNQVTGSFVILRRDVVDFALPFPADTDIAIHDHWLGVCAAALGDIALYPFVVQDYVQHAGNVLGEERKTTVREAIQHMSLNGGVRAHLDQVTLHRWGWRVSMARTLCSRRIPTHVRVAVEPMARGTVGVAILRALSGSIIDSRLSVRAAIGLLISSWWWPKVAGRSPF